MIKYIATIILCVFSVSCAVQSTSTKMYPNEILGTWRTVENVKGNRRYIHYYPNGKSVVVEVIYGGLVAYEAEWWVEGDCLYKRIIDSLYTGDLEDSIGFISKDKINHISTKLFQLWEVYDAGTELVSYIRLADNQHLNKYQRIDYELSKLQSTLPYDNGKGTTLISAVRDGNTIIYIYRKINKSKSDFDLNNEKANNIGTIQREPGLLNDKMNFKYIYLLSNEDMATIDITPEEYSMKRK